MRKIMLMVWLRFVLGLIIFVKHIDFPLFSICHFIHVLVHVITVWNRRIDWQIRDKVKVHLAQ